MGWLARLFGKERGSDTVTSPEEPEIRSPFSDFGWRRAEAGIAELLARDLESFARVHREEEFYAVGLDCNSEYGDMLLSANTPLALRKSAESYAQSGSDSEIADEEAELRWEFADWAYHGFNYQESGGYGEYKALLPNADCFEHPDDREMFMEIATRALLSLEKRGVLGLLRRTSDFRLICVDDGEDLAEAEARMKRVAGTDS